ncbi:MAG: hypothetical protein ACYDCL_14265 [Myxococcales bacterium]
MTPPTTIYVGLLDEGVDVWRPVLAESVQGSKYRIIEQAYDRKMEKWEFEPGDEVICDLVKWENKPVLVAKRKA